MRLNTLSNLRVLGHDRHGAIRGDANKGIGRERRRSRCLRSFRKHLRDGIGIEGQQNSSSAQRGYAKKGATVEEHGLHGTS